MNKSALQWLIIIVAVTFYEKDSQSLTKSFADIVSKLVQILFHLILAFFDLCSVCSFVLYSNIASSVIDLK